jgi:hypothetical protein
VQVGDSLWSCEVEDYREFARPVPFKDGQGRYLEGDQAERRGYFQPGVRRIDDAPYRRIVASGLDPEVAQLLEHVAGVVSTAPAQNYASASDARLIEDVSRAAAIRWLLRRGDVSEVTPMPTNNPGYDLLAQTSAGPIYVEVKGTRGRRPRFFLSEGERLFSEANSERFMLLVVVEVDVETGGSGAIHVLHGQLTKASAGLHAHQWLGELDAS